LSLLGTLFIYLCSLINFLLDFSFQSTLILLNLSPGLVEPKLVNILLHQSISAKRAFGVLFVEQFGDAG
jgi:hypothetical protein